MALSRMSGDKGDVRGQRVQMGGDIGILELVAPRKRTFLERRVSHSVHENPGERQHIFLLKKARTRKAEHLA